MKKIDPLTKQYLKKGGFSSLILAIVSGFVFYFLFFNHWSDLEEIFYMPLVGFLYVIFLSIFFLCSKSKYPTKKYLKDCELAGVNKQEMIYAVMIINAPGIIVGLIIIASVIGSLLQHYI